MTLKELATELRASAELQISMAEQIENVLALGDVFGPLFNMFGSSQAAKPVKTELEPNFVRLNTPPVEKISKPQVAVAGEKEEKEEEKGYKPNKTFPEPTTETKESIRQELKAHPPEYWTTERRRSLAQKYNVSQARIVAFWLASKGEINAWKRRSTLKAATP